jgi:signal transduction histidine kinase
VGNLFIVEIQSPGRLRLSRFDMKSKTLKPATWPIHLTDVRDRLSQQFEAVPPDVRFREIDANLLLARDPPTAVAPLPMLARELIRMRRIGHSVEPAALPLFPTTWAIVEFNQECIVNQVLPDLLNRYFSALGTGEYHVSVVSRGEPRQVIYQSDPLTATTDFAMADSAAELFRFGPRRVVAFAGHRGFAARAEPRTFTMALPPRLSGHWELFVEHRLGSLDAAVNQLRRRNLAVSFGILLVLLASVIMIIVASERARVLARLQMEFAAGISHELRTPLTVIQALTHNLTTGIVKDPTHVKEYARMVQSEARGLYSIVDQVLLFAETRSIRQRYDVGPVEVVEVVDHALAALTTQIQEVGTEIVTDIPDDLPVVRGSVAPLTHCLRNLISNALKYGYNVGGYSAIQVKGSTDSENNEVRISVIDNGPGIDPSDFPHIFEAFYRGRTVSPGTRGAGLGLYLVKHLIEAQGGRITFESRPGGSTFVLHIPIFNEELRYGSAAASG